MLLQPLQYTEREHLQIHQVATKLKSSMQKCLILTQTKMPSDVFKHAYCTMFVTRQESVRLHDPETKKQKSWNDSLCDAFRDLESQTLEK